MMTPCNLQGQCAKRVNHSQSFIVPVESDRYHCVGLVTVSILAQHIALVDTAVAIFATCIVNQNE